MEDRDAHDKHQHVTRRSWFRAATIAGGAGLASAASLLPSIARAAPISSYASTAVARAQSLSGQAVVATAGCSAQGDGGEALWFATGDVVPAYSGQIKRHTLRFYDVDGVEFEYLGARVNVLAFDIPEGTADAGAALNEVLQSGESHYFFPDRNYSVATSIVVRRSTRLELSKEARFLPSVHCFVNGVLGDTAGAYTGNGDIEITGGVFQHDGSQCYGIGFAHGRNIRLANIRFEGSHDVHVVEFCGCSNVRVENCSFSATGAPDGTGEVLQFDGAFDRGGQKGFHVFGPWDDTVCEDCVVSGCSFDGGTVGVGTHSTYFFADGQRAMHGRIRITNNTFMNQTRYAIRAENWVDSIVDHNVIDSSGNHAIQIIGSVALSVDSNRIRSNLGGIRATPKDAYALFGIDEPLPSAGLLVTNNAIVRSGPWAAIELDQAIDSIVRGNSLSGLSASGIVVADSSEIRVEGNVITNAAWVGVDVSGSEYVSLGRNVIVMSNKEGIRFTSCTSCFSLADSLDAPCTNGTNSAIRIASTWGVFVKGATVRQRMFVTAYRYALYQSDSEDIVSTENYFEAGSSGVDNL